MSDWGFLDCSVNIALLNLKPFVKQSYEEKKEKKHRAIERQKLLASVNQL